MTTTTAQAIMRHDAAARIRAINDTPNGRIFSRGRRPDMRSSVFPSKNGPDNQPYVDILLGRVEGIY